MRSQQVWLFTKLRGDFLLCDEIFKTHPKDPEIDFTLSVKVLFSLVKIQIGASLESCPV